jgi:hypothetical protein
MIRKTDSFASEIALVLAVSGFTGILHLSN